MEAPREGNARADAAPVLLSLLPAQLPGTRRGRVGKGSRSWQSPTAKAGRVGPKPSASPPRGKSILGCLVWSQLCPEKPLQRCNSSSDAESLQNHQWQGAVLLSIITPPSLPPFPNQRELSRALLFSRSCTGSQLGRARSDSGSTWLQNGPAAGQS